MCVTFCHRCSILYFNHEDCLPQLCPVAAEIFGTCDDCVHRQNGFCALTRAPLPQSGGCCHWNVSLVSGWQTVTAEMCDSLGQGANESIADLLTGLDAPFTPNANGQVSVDPDALGIPETYGQGTD